MVLSVGRQGGVYASFTPASLGVLLHVYRRGEGAEEEEDVTEETDSSEASDTFLKQQSLGR